MWREKGVRGRVCNGNAMETEGETAAALQRKSARGEGKKVYVSESVHRKRGTGEGGRDNVCISHAVKGILGFFLL